MEAIIFYSINTSTFSESETKSRVCLVDRHCLLNTKPKSIERCFDIWGRICDFRDEIVFLLVGSRFSRESWVIYRLASMPVGDFDYEWRLFIFIFVTQTLFRTNGRKCMYKISYMLIAKAFLTAFLPAFWSAEASRSNMYNFYIINRRTLWLDKEISNLKVYF